MNDQCSLLMEQIKMKQKLIIIGAGSVGKYIAYNQNDFQNNFEIIGFLDDDIAKHNTFIAAIPVLGSVNKIIDYANKGYALVWGIAFPSIKNKLYNQYKNLQFDYPNFIAKNAWISQAVTIGKGCIIYPGCSINYESSVGDFVVLNMNCALGHNATIGNFASFAPGVNLGGYTQIGDRTDMGIGSATKQFVKIGKDCVIGGQAMVIQNIEDDKKVKGVPAK